MSASIPCRAAVFAAALFTLACGLVSVGERPQVPFSATEMTVAKVQPQASWLEVTLMSPKFNRVFYFPASEACKALIQPDATLSYRRSGGYGYVERGDVRCDASGIGSLRQWRDGLPRPTLGGSAAKPRSRCEFREVYRDGDVVMVRGKFLLASYLQWPRPDDTIAVFKNDPVCNQALSGDMAQMEYNANGANPLVLVQQGGRCPLEGLIRPE